jgi:hypothetical protein
MFGMSIPASVVVGAGLALSSTAVAIQVLRDKNEIQTKHGRAAFGVLLFQVSRFLSPLEVGLFQVKLVLSPSERDTECLCSWNLELRWERRDPTKHGSAASEVLLFQVSRFSSFLKTGLSQGRQDNNKMQSKHSQAAFGALRF